MPVGRPFNRSALAQQSRATASPYGGQAGRRRWRRVTMRAWRLSAGVLLDDPLLRRRDRWL